LLSKPLEDPFRVVEEFRDFTGFHVDFTFLLRFVAFKVDHQPFCVQHGQFLHLVPNLFRVVLCLVDHVHPHRGQRVFDRFPVRRVRGTLLPGGW
jgi:hypothetical protein